MHGRTRLPHRTYHVRMGARSRSATHQHHNRGSQLTSLEQPNEENHTTQALLDACRLLSVTACSSCLGASRRSLRLCRPLHPPPAPNLGRQSHSLLSSLVASYLPGGDVRPSCSRHYAAGYAENGNKRRGNQLAHGAFDHTIRKSPGRL